DEMVDDAPVAIVPVQAIGTGGEVAAVEQHPNEAVGFEFVAQWLARLQELVAIVEPGWLDQASDGKNDGRTIKVCR
ncbi:hypothetical protein, partial [Pseudomonas sp. GP01-A4]|uniref:hypothetical protein n=1 Tax=Pseudomonas sp. GP01-A4 TaxID=2070571 RepID=UPI001304F85E